MLAAAAVVNAEDAASEELIGDGSDGNLSCPVHRFELYDEDGIQIRSSDKNPKPFSLEKTCGKCHDYETIKGGWHFNGHNAEIEKGRNSQPWVLVDVKSRTQIPVSGRGWDGTFRPEEIGLSPWEFVKTFYSHFPGGSYGVMESDNPDEDIRKAISGNYEINCLACHHNSFTEDQSEAALQSARQNYKWIPTASSGKGVIKGVASGLDDFFDPEFDKGVEVEYDKSIFDAEDKVFFDIGMPTNERCYFCHSNWDQSVGEDECWGQDMDVHVQAGMKCIDCHRNGDDHMITRGYEAEGEGKTLTCEGCHIGEGGGVPESGRLGAPRPKHAGIPTVHFEKLTCTACHSGSWPREEAGRIKTARIHRTGLHGKHNLKPDQPHVYGPVLMKGDDGKIGPYKVMFPAYWAKVVGGRVVPMQPKDVLEKAGRILKQSSEFVYDWAELTEEQIAETLKLLDGQGQAVYIAGGKVYALNDKGGVSVEQNEAARPYAWPMAHDVRGAQQSLGVRLCKDCHTNDSPFFFGRLEFDTPVVSEGGVEYVQMIQLEGIDATYMKLFNASFVFRPMLKIIAVLCCGLIGVIILAYVLRAVRCVTGFWEKGGRKDV